MFARLFCGPRTLLQAPSATGVRGVSAGERRGLKEASSEDESILQARPPTHSTSTLPLSSSLYLSLYQVLPGVGMSVHGCEQV